MVMPSPLNGIETSWFWFCSILITSTHHFPQKLFFSIWHPHVWYENKQTIEIWTWEKLASEAATRPTFLIILTKYRTQINISFVNKMQNYKHLGFEETTSREFTGWEGRGAMGGCADLQVLMRMLGVWIWGGMGVCIWGWVCEYEDGGVYMRMGVWIWGGCVHMREGGMNTWTGKGQLWYWGPGCSSTCPFASAVFQDTQKPRNNCFFCFITKRRELFNSQVLVESATGQYTQNNWGSREKQPITAKYEAWAFLLERFVMCNIFPKSGSFTGETQRRRATTP